MVIRHNSQPRSAHKSVLADPSADRFGHSAQFRVGAALELIVPLEFERDIVRPALRAFDEAVVESGHGSWGLYTKILRSRHLRSRDAHFAALSSGMASK